MALDQATTDFLAAIAASAEQGALPAWKHGVEAARAASSKIASLCGTGPAMYRVEDHTLRGHDDGTFNIRLLIPSETVTSVLLYIHGGGWVLHNIDTYSALGRELAKRTGSTVVMVNYRKAPEHPFPTPLEDSWSALEWTARRLTHLAGSDARLFIAGDSAGGNLAAALTHRARDRGTVNIDAQVLIYPVTDADSSRASYGNPDNQTVLNTESMAWFWEQYLGSQPGPRTPEMCPLRATSLADLPPALIITAEHDIVRDEGEIYAKRLAEEGVKVEHVCWPGQMHTFFSMVNVLPASNLALQAVSTFLNKCDSPKGGTLGGC